MQISIVDRQENLNSEARELAERRLLFALSRFDSKIDGVFFRVADTSRAKGNNEKKYSVTVKLKRLPEVQVSCVDSDFEAGLSYVADRVGRTVQRVIERSQEFERRRLYPV